jgi:hypothetical protein
LGEEADLISIQYRVDFAHPTEVAVRSTNLASTFVVRTIIPQVTTTRSSKFVDPKDLIRYLLHLSFMKLPITGQTEKLPVCGAISNLVVLAASFAKIVSYQVGT